LADNIKKRALNVLGDIACQ